MKIKNIETRKKLLLQHSFLFFRNIKTYHKLTIIFKQKTEVIYVVYEILQFPRLRVNLVELRVLET